MPADPPIPDAAVDAFLAAEDAYRRGSYRTGRWIVVDAARAGLAAAYPILADQWLDRVAQDVVGVPAQGVDDRERVTWGDVRAAVRGDDREGTPDVRE